MKLKTEFGKELQTKMRDSKKNIFLLVIIVILIAIVYSFETLYELLKVALDLILSIFIGIAEVFFDF